MARSWGTPREGRRGKREKRKKGPRYSWNTRVPHRHCASTCYQPVWYLSSYIYLVSAVIQFNGAGEHVQRLITILRALIVGNVVSTRLKRLNGTGDRIWTCMKDWKNFTCNYLTQVVEDLENTNIIKFSIL